MIGPTGAVRVMVATKPVDFRKGAEGLAALVRETMQADPFSGAVYVFRAKRADRVKLIYWDGTGVCLFASVWRMASSAGRMFKTASFVSRPLSYRHWWRGSTGGEFTEPRDTGSGLPKLICGTVNQHCLDSRGVCVNMIYSHHDGHGGFASRRSLDAQGDGPGGAGACRTAGTDHQGAATSSLRQASRIAPGRPIAAWARGGRAG